MTYSSLVSWHVTSYDREQFLRYAVDVEHPRVGFHADIPQKCVILNSYEFCTECSRSVASSVCRTGLVGNINGYQLTSSQRSNLSMIPTMGSA